MDFSRSVLAATLAAMCFLTGSATAEITWGQDYVAAVKQAAKENKTILLGFTGSKWCPPCMQMDKLVFSQPAFEEFAKKNLVLVKVDFASPYGVAPSPYAEQHVYLSQRFGVQGFPTYIVLTPKGVPLAEESGLFARTPQEFIQWVKAAEKVD